MNYLTITGVVIFCIFILMYVGSSKDNLDPFNQVLNLAPNSNVRFITAMPNGELLLSNETVRKFSDDIRNRDQMIMNDYIARDRNEGNAAISRMTAKDNAVINAYKAADTSYYKANQTDAQNRANSARTSAISAANNNTNTYYVKKNTNYTLTADGSVLGRGSQDNWGERYVTWSGAKHVKKSKFIIK